LTPKEWEAGFKRRIKGEPDGGLLNREKKKQGGEEWKAGCLKTGRLFLLNMFGR